MNEINFPTIAGGFLNNRIIKDRILKQIFKGIEMCRTNGMCVISLIVFTDNWVISSKLRCSDKSYLKQVLSKSYMWEHVLFGLIVNFGIMVGPCCIEYSAYWF